MRKLVVLLAIFLTRCDGFRSTLGLDHQGPNEFDSVPLSPLSLPRDFEKTPATEKKEERKPDSKAFPFAFAELDNELQDLSEKNEDVASEAVPSPAEDQASAQNLLLGTPSEKGATVSADRSNENGFPLPTKATPKDLPKKLEDTPSKGKSSESKVDVQEEKPSPLPLTRAVSRPILNSPREEETPEEAPTQWADQEAVLNNSWLSVQEGAPLQKAELHILDSEITTLGEGATDPTSAKGNAVPVGRSAPKKEFDVPAAKRGSTTPASFNSPKDRAPAESQSSQSVQGGEKAVSHPQGMAPILKVPDKKRVRKKAQALTPAEPNISSRKVSPSQQPPATRKILRPDPSPAKTTMKPILPKRTTRATGVRKTAKLQKRPPRRIVRRRVPNRAVPLQSPAVPDSIPVQQSQGKAQ